MPIHVNVTAKVNSKSIRREIHNGRSHWVIPSYTLPFDVVMNGVMYPKAEVEKHFSGLEGTLAPFGHPTVNGQHVSAFSPEGINAFHVGAWNRNVKLAGTRVYAEKWLDVDVANRTENGKRLIERLEALERGDDVPPIHSSVALFIERMEVADKDREKLGYEAVAKIHQMDHDAILLDEVGAATPEQGVGLMVNADDAQNIKVNSGALVGESFREREKRLSQAVYETFGKGEDNYAWVADFTTDQVVVVSKDGTKVYGYAVDNGIVSFDGEGVPVERQETWVARLPVVNKIVSFFKNRQARPDFSEVSTMDEKEKAALVEAVNASVASTLQGVLAPITERLSALETNQKTITESVTANARAVEAEKRAVVAAKLGEVVANALSGEALDKAHEQCLTAKGIGQGSTAQEKPALAPNADEVANYFGSNK